MTEIRPIPNPIVTTNGALLNHLGNICDKSRPILFCLKHQIYYAMRGDSKEDINNFLKGCKAPGGKNNPEFRFYDK